MRWAEVEWVRHGESLSQAARELQHGREAVARIPLRGRGGRGGTSRGVALEAGDSAESLHPWLAEETGRKVLPSTLSMEGSESGQGGVLEDRATRIRQIQCSPIMFQVLEGADGGELEVNGPPGQGAVVHCTSGVQNGGSQESDMDNPPGPKGGNQQLGLDPGHQLVDQRHEVPLEFLPGV
ncbi:hypothetical protein NDU88_007282 [Pleurodeles waltl]|uniref:Uncharacterized protein n=1 Tax=Pleurodeles waltl TaxID=8319 RepID=A0AAV7UQ08_PLEWA|nr:hypothetical protein NDU88_007282 [Pleurodeles waltl]